MRKFGLSVLLALAGLVALAPPFSLTESVGLVSRSAASRRRSIRGSQPGCQGVN